MPQAGWATWKSVVFFCGFCKQAGRPKHNSRSTNALHGPRGVTADPDSLEIRGALVLARARVPQTVFTSRALCMDCARHPPPRTAASTWTVSEYSCLLRGAVRLLPWPGLVASVRPRCPSSSALSRWLRGAAAPLLGTSSRAGGSGRGAYRRPPEPPAHSDPRASTDTRPLSVCPARSPWARACGPATCTSTRRAGALQRWFRRWTASWGGWHDGGAAGEQGCVWSGHGRPLSGQRRGPGVGGQGSGARGQGRRLRGFPFYNVFAEYFPMSNLLAAESQKQDLSGYLFNICCFLSFLLESLVI